MLADVELKLIAPGPGFELSAKQLVWKWQVCLWGPWSLYGTFQARLVDQVPGLFSWVSDLLC
jgi:hypothetical protein